MLGLLMLWFIEVIVIKYWTFDWRGRIILPRCFEGWVVVLGCITKVIRIARMKSLVPPDRVFVYLMVRRGVLNTR